MILLLKYWWYVVYFPKNETSLAKKGNKILDIRQVVEDTGSYDTIHNILKTQYEKCKICPTNVNRSSETQKLKRVLICKCSEKAY